MIVRCLICVGRKIAQQRDLMSCLPPLRRSLITNRKIAFLFRLGAALAPAWLASPLLAQTAAYQPAEWAKVVAAAKKEGRVTF